MGVQWRKENPNPRVHRSGGKLGEPRFPLERMDPRVGIFLSPLDTHDGFYLPYTTSKMVVYTPIIHTIRDVQVLIGTDSLSICVFSMWKNHLVLFVTLEFHSFV